MWPRMRASISPRRRTSNRPVAASARAARKQHVVALVRAQHVVDQIGRDRDLAAGFFFAGKAAVDQAGDDGAVAERALHQRGFREPGLEIVTEHVLVEQKFEREVAARDVRRDVADAPDRERVFVGDEPHRLHARALEPPRQQHAERLMRQAAFERIADEIIFAAAWKSLDQEFAGAGHLRAPILDFQPLADLRRQFAPGARIGDDLAHPRGEIGREREFAALIGGDLGVFRGRARHIDLVLDQRLVFEHLAGEHEGVARHHGLDEIFLDLAEQPAAARDHARGARAHQADFQHVGLDDGADIEPVALRHAGVGDAPASVLALPDAGEALVGLERVAAGGDEIDHRVEIRAREADIGRRGRHFGIKLVARERRAAGAAEHMLRQNVERAEAQGWRVLGVLGDGVERGAAFQHFETVRRHQHAFRRLVHAVIGAADALQQPRRALRRADIDDEVDVAPVDAEVERGGADHGAQPAGGHRGLHLAPLRHVERAVMQRDGEIVVVDAPEILENEFGLAAGVDENERGAVRLDEAVDFFQRVARRMTRPRQPLLRIEHRDIGRGAARGDDDIGARGARALRHHEARKLLRLRHGRGQPDAGQLRRDAKQPGEAEREQIAALRSDQRMQFVEDHALEGAEQIRRIGGSEKQRQLLRRGEQNLRRVAALARPLRGRRVAGARFDADRQPHFLDRRFQIAGDIDRQRLERRNVERVQPALAAQVAAGASQFSSPACGGGRRAKGPARSGRPDDGSARREGAGRCRRGARGPPPYPPPQAGEEKWVRG